MIRDAAMEPLPYLKADSISARFRVDDALLQKFSELRATRVRKLLRAMNQRRPELLRELVEHARRNDPYELAALVREAITPSNMRDRLKCLGFGAEWQDAELNFLAADGCTVAVEARGRGQLLTGLGVGRKLLRSFPELRALLLTNSTFQPPWQGGAGPVSNPNTSGNGVSIGDLTGVDARWTIEAVVTSYDFGLGGGSSDPGIVVTSPTVSDPYGSGVAGDFGILETSQVQVPWSQQGLKFIHDHAGETGVTTPYSISFGTNGGSNWAVHCVCNALVITYTGAGGEPCPSSKAGALALTGCTGGPCGSSEPPGGCPNCGGTGCGCPWGHGPAPGLPPFSLPGFRPGRF